VVLLEGWGTKLATRGYCILLELVASILSLSYNVSYSFCVELWRRRCCGVKSLGESLLMGGEEKELLLSLPNHVDDDDHFP
jgi:hypothetical protein